MEAKVDLKEVKIRILSTGTWKRYGGGRLEGNG
jgi:hypothetical protein